MTDGPINGKPAAVYRLPLADTYTAEQALAEAQARDLEDVLVLGSTEEGHLVLLSSRMSRAEALWLIEKAREWTLQS